MKQICPIHRFSYSGNVCPFCEKDRINGLAHRFVKTVENNTISVHNVKKGKQQEITENDLQKLINKFNFKK